MRLSRGRWSYKCMDLESSLQTDYVGSDYALQEFYLYKDRGDFYVDAVHIGKHPTASGTGLDRSSDLDLQSDCIPNFFSLPSICSRVLLFSSRRFPQEEASTLWEPRRVLRGDRCRQRHVGRPTDQLRDQSQASRMRLRFPASRSWLPAGNQYVEFI